MTEWKDPCKAAMDGMNNGIFNARGNRRMAVSSPEPQLAIDPYVHIHKIQRLEAEVKRLTEANQRLERELGKKILMEKAHEKSRENAAKVAEAGGMAGSDAIPENLREAVERVKASRNVPPET